MAKTRRSGQDEAKKARTGQLFPKKPGQDGGQPSCRKQGLEPKTYGLKSYDRTTEPNSQLRKLPDIDQLADFCDLTPRNSLESNRFLFSLKAGSPTANKSPRTAWQDPPKDRESKPLRAGWTPKEQERRRQQTSSPESGQRTGRGQAKSARQGQRLSVAAVFAIAYEKVAPPRGTVQGKYIHLFGCESGSFFPLGGSKA